MRGKEPCIMQPIKTIIDKLVPKECVCDWCILKQICSSMYGSNPRELFQIKCVEILKWELNTSQEEEIDISKVWLVWVDKGYAKAFSSVYKEFGSDLLVEDMYRKIKEKAHEGSC